MFDSLVINLARDKYKCTCIFIHVIYKYIFIFAALTSGSKSDDVRYSLHDEQSNDKSSTISHNAHKAKSEAADPARDDSPRPNSSTAYKWPGIETVMVSYHRYLDGMYIHVSLTYNVYI